MTLHTYTTPAGATVEARDREEAKAIAGTRVKYSHTNTTAPLPPELRGLEELRKAIEGVK